MCCAGSDRYYQKTSTKSKYGMWDFREWLLSEEQDLVPPGVLRGYDHAFNQQLMRLIQRTHDPRLRTTFQEMLDCPIVDRRGRCRSFSDYILSPLLKNGINERYDVEAALAYVIEKMLLDRTNTGEPRITVFGGFEERPDYVSGNPLQARFMKFLQFAVHGQSHAPEPAEAITRAIADEENTSQDGQAETVRQGTGFRKHRQRDRSVQWSSGGKC